MEKQRKMDNLLDHVSLKELEKTKQYTIKLSYFLLDQLNEHLENLKQLRHPEKNRQRWLVSALREKLSRDKESPNIPVIKFLNVKMPENLVRELEEALDKSRKARASCSKKQFILEAIADKMESEKALVQKKLSEYYASKK